jgi:hypothetical protein
VDRAGSEKEEEIQMFDEKKVQGNNVLQNSSVPSLWSRTDE